MTQKNVSYKARNIILGFFDENKKNALFQRTLLFICGLFIMAIGVDLSVKANLGVSPGCFPNFQRSLCVQPQFSLNAGTDNDHHEHSAHRPAVAPPAE